MAPATLLSLRDRLAPPAASRPASGSAPRRPEMLRVLDLAAHLFGVDAAALVLARPDGLAVEAASGGGAADGAVATACRLFEALAAVPPEAGRPAGVLEEIVPGRGFAAATPVLSAAGRCLGAVCLLDAGRHALLTGMQRRLFAEFGGLLPPVLDAAEPDRAA